MNFYPLTLAAVNAETSHAVRLRLSIHDQYRSTFAFKAGQFLTLRAVVNGVDMRRSYSICSRPAQLASQGTVEVAVKAVNGGAFSPWVQTLKAGDTLHVLPPEGRFSLPQNTQRVLCIAAGSGITPLLSIMADTLENDSSTQFTLLYGNRNTASTMFLEDLYALKNRYASRLDLHPVMSRQSSDIALHNGRIDAAKLYSFLNGPLKGITFDHAMVCGPNDLIDVCEGMLPTILPSLGVGKVHAERFGSPNPVSGGYELGGDGQIEPIAKLTIVSGGQSHSVPWLGTTPLLLDAGLAAGLDLPYACKGGVCCTCRAKVIEGAVTMDKNYTLEADEVAAGFVLTCQCRPASEAVVVSYDER